MLMSAPNGGKVEGNFTAQELDSIMKNHENKFMKVSYYVIFSNSLFVLKFEKNIMERTKLPLGSFSQSGTRKFHDIAISTMTQHLSFVSEFQILLAKFFNFRSISRSNFYHSSRTDHYSLTV